MEPEQPTNEHLGAAWEIAIVVVMVALVVAILAATVFQIRRRRKQKQRRALEADVESGKTPKRTIRAQDKRRSGSVNTFDEIVEKHTHPVTVRDDRHTEEIRKPSPTLQSKHANDSSYSEYLSKKPPNYYWEQRFH